MNKFGMKQYKKAMKRILSFSVAISLCAQSPLTCELTAFAKEDIGTAAQTEDELEIPTDGEQVTVTEPATDDKLTSDNAASVTYNIDNEGKLTVSGEGEIVDENGEIRWKNELDSIVTAEVRLQKTTDASNMFKDCEHLKSVNLQDFKTTALKKMNSMFENCTALTELNLSTFNLSILEEAKDMLKGCSGLETIYVPRGLTLEVALPEVSNPYREYWYVDGEETEEIDKLPKETTSTVIVRKGYRKEKVELSGITCAGKTYDGSPVVIDNFGVQVKRESDKKDVSGDVTLVYHYSGTLKDKTELEKTTEAPDQAGDYTLTVSVDDENEDYTGELPISFSIEQATVNVKARDVTIEQGDELPASYLYDVSGFLSDEKLVKVPTLTCSVKDSSEIGTYPIVPDDADAGNNYAVQYTNGTLHIVEPTLYKLLEIEELDEIYAPNGTALKDIVLPSVINIKTESDEYTTANINWNRNQLLYETTYDPECKTSQTFYLGGTIELPRKVDRNSNSLDIDIKVTVLEDIIPGAAASLPYPDIQDGSILKKGTGVTLISDTLGATIYYTVDGTKPTRESAVFSNPIIIERYTVILAFASKPGYEDSKIVRYSFGIEREEPGTEDPEEDDEEAEGENEGVAEEDIPEDGKIPTGIWISQIPDQTYTGNAIKPEFRVYDHKLRLKENADYTVRYKNNVNVNSLGSADKEACIEITGIGNYDGKYVATFAIIPKSISDDDVAADDLALQYQKKKAAKVNPIVIWNGKTLKLNRDFTVSVEEFTKRGDYVVDLFGIGNYAGEKRIRVTVTSGVIASKLKISKISDQTYTGKEITPAVVVMNGKERLQNNIHYTVRYENNVEVGTAYAVVTGKDRITGVRRIPFKITPITTFNKTNVIVNMEFDGEAVYTGLPVHPAKITVKAPGYGEKGQKRLMELVQGEDYEISYEKDINAGTASVVIKGIHNYAGTVKKTYKIAKCDITKKTEAEFKIEMKNSYYYRKGGCKPAPVITYNNKVLQAGIDYTLVYRNINKVCDKTDAAKVPCVIIKGKGNFMGQQKKIYLIAQRDIAGLSINVPDKVWTNKKNNYKNKVTVVDVDGKLLVSGKDYDKKIIYSYDETGETISDGANIPVGTTVRVTVKSTDSDSYFGTLSGTFRIVGANIAKAKVKIPDQIYTGRAIEPVDDIVVYMNGEIVDSNNYEIVEFCNNINKGTATVKLRGKNNLGGYKVAKFAIKRKKFS